MISISDLSKEYGSVKALQHINVAFEKGSITGIVGANGAGKTTLFRCIVGLEKYSGEVSSTHDQLKDVVGYLPAEPFFFDKMTGQEYLTLCLQARGNKQSVSAQANVFDLPLNRYVTGYSTGMKKKLAMTAVLLQRNEVYILDEPFSGVDFESNLVLVEVIKKLKSTGKTVILSSHMLASLTEICDTIHVLKQGQLEHSIDKADFVDLGAQVSELSPQIDLSAFGL